MRVQIIFGQGANILQCLPLTFRQSSSTTYNCNQDPDGDIFIYGPKKEDEVAASRTLGMIHPKPNIDPTGWAILVSPKR